MVSKRRKSQLASKAVLTSPAVVKTKLDEGEVTQLVDLANPEQSGLTSKFAVM